MTSRRRIFEDQSYVHFVTFSCYRRCRHLDHERLCRIVLGNLQKQLASFRARCHGFVLMPDHVHILLQFPGNGVVSQFLQRWKQQSSFYAGKAIQEHLPHYGLLLRKTDPFWQRRFYDFPIESKRKYLEKLQYIHENPVRAGLVETPSDWRWSSAAWYEWGKSVGIEITPIDALS